MSITIISNLQFHLGRYVWASPAFYGIIIVYFFLVKNVECNGNKNWHLVPRGSFT